jgi:hypothetical protein
VLLAGGPLAALSGSLRPRSDVSGFVPIPDLAPVRSLGQGWVKADIRTVSGRQRIRFQYRAVAVLTSDQRRAYFGEHPNR